MGLELRVRARSLKQRFALAEGLTGKGQVLRASLRGRLGGDGTTPVPLRVSPLNGRTVWLRPRSTDLMNLGDYLNLELYLPPPEIRDQELRHVVELGSNMGACLTGLSVRYPGARILGVEPDRGNFELAVRNVADFGDRVSVVNAAIWHRKADLVMTDEGKGEHGFTVRERNAEDSPTTSVTRGLPIAALLDANLPEGATVDYMHVSMEGAEPEAFETAGWPERVRSLRVEAHPYFDYDAATCIAQLETLGYRAWAAPELPNKWVYAVRA